MSDDLVKWLRDDVTCYIASWEGEFACDDADHVRAKMDTAKAEQAAATLRALSAERDALKAKLDEAVGQEYVPAQDERVKRLVEAAVRALERLDASLFTNSEHQQAKDILRAALRDMGDG